MESRQTNSIEETEDEDNDQDDDNDENRDISENRNEENEDANDGENNEYPEESQANDNGDTENAEDQNISVLPKIRKDQILKWSDNGEQREARVMSRAGKASSRSKNWYNIEYTEPEHLRGSSLSIDLSTVENLSFKENDVQHDEVYITTNIDFTKAKQDELTKWRKMMVYSEVEDNGQKCISSRWVNTVKNENEKVILKSRLVAKGFEEDCLDEMNKNSPTIDKSSLRAVLSIISSQKWNINTMDVKTAFLQGEQIDRDVFIRPPKEANTTKVWKLNKCVYGLADASLKWYEKVHKTMKHLNGSVSKIDPSVFYWHNEGMLIGVLAIHVDDFLWAGTDEFSNIIQKIRNTFEISKEDSTSFQYIGLELAQTDNVIVLSQRRYCQTIEEVAVDKRDKSSPLKEDEKSVMRAKLGQLLWVARQSRPDISFELSDIAGRIQKSTINDLKRINKTVKRVKLDEIELKFQNLGKHLELIVFTDASFGNLHDGGSQGGHFIFARGDDGKVNPIAWQSRKLRRVTKSTLASETLALSDGVDSAFSIAMLFGEMLYNDSSKTIPITCYVDNADLVEALKSQKSVTDKRLRIEIASMKQMLDRKELKAVQWVGSKDQIANCLTKLGASPFDLLDCLCNGKLNVT